MGHIPPLSISTWASLRKEYPPWMWMTSYNKVRSQAEWECGKGEWKLSFNVHLCIFWLLMECDHPLPAVATGWELFFQLCLPLHDYYIFILWADTNPYFLRLLFWAFCHNKEKNKTITCMVAEIMWTLLNGHHLLDLFSQSLGWVQTHNDTVRPCFKQTDKPVWIPVVVWMKVSPISSEGVALPGSVALL